MNIDMLGCKYAGTFAWVGDNEYYHPPRPWVVFLKIDQ